jgi:hypothetical protein
MLLPLLASAVLASVTPPGATAAPALAPASSAPAPQPPDARPASQPSIESLLQSQDPDRGADTDEDQAGLPAGPGPIPYGQLDGKAYDDALRNAAASARADAGPLDGGWTLAAVDGRRMYRFQLLDRGYGLGQAEGAWRDLDGGPRLQGSGFIDQIAYSGDQLTLRFYEADPNDEVLITLKASKAGGWSGQLLRHGEWTQVTFSRN